MGEQDVGYGGFPILGSLAEYQLYLREKRDYKDASRLCKDVMRSWKGKIRRVKAQIELKTVFKIIFVFLNPTKA